MKRLKKGRNKHEQFICFSASSFSEKKKWISVGMMISLEAGVPRKNYWIIQVRDVMIWKGRNRNIWGTYERWRKDGLVIRCKGGRGVDIWGSRMIDGGAMHWDKIWGDDEPPPHLTDTLTFGSHAQLVGNWRHGREWDHPGLQVRRGSRTQLQKTPTPWHSALLLSQFHIHSCLA